MSVKRSISTAVTKMPKTTTRRTRQATLPYSTPAASTTAVTRPKPSSTSHRSTKEASSDHSREHKPEKQIRGKGKDSHLYTDDNPATTLHGTGFKDASAAQRTIDLVSRRSLTYQFQTINTMFHRAKGHPHRNADMEAAMAVFRHWLDNQYLSQREHIAKESAGGYKPVLGRQVVAAYLPYISDLSVSSLELSTLQPKEGREMEETELEVVLRQGQKFAAVYCSQDKKKRLANTLVEEDEPGGDDWEGLRLQVLMKLVGSPRPAREYADTELWRNGSRQEGLSGWHMLVVTWGWSPLTEKTLLSTLQSRSS